MSYRVSKLQAGTPAALHQERLRIGQLQNFTERLLLVGCALVIGFHDAVADPVTDIAALLHRAVVDPARQLSLIDVGSERSFQLLLAALRQRCEMRIRGLTGSELGDELGRTFDQR